MDKGISATLEQSGAKSMKGNAWKRFREDVCNLISGINVFQRDPTAFDHVPKKALLDAEMLRAVFESGLD